MRPITTSDREMWILGDDPAVEPTADEVWPEYLSSNDESKLTLGSEPIRYETRGLSVRERCWARGEGHAVRGNAFLGFLPYVQACLVAVHGAKEVSEEEVSKMRVPYMGMSILTEDAVFGLLGQKEDRIVHLGGIIFARNHIGSSEDDDLGEG